MVEQKPASGADPRVQELQSQTQGLPQQPDRSQLFSPAVTERNRNLYSQRRGHIGGDYALQSLTKLISESAISDYTVEQVISKADPSDYRQELARLGYVLKLDDQEENKTASPSKTAKKMSLNLCSLTLEALIAKINAMGPEALENTQTMQNLNNQQDGRYTLTHLIQYIFHGVQIYINRRRQIFMHLGQDEMNETQIQNFNNKYFKKDSFWEDQGIQPQRGALRRLDNQSKTQGLNDIRSSQYGNLLNKDGQNQCSYSSFATEVTSYDDKRQTIHQDFGQNREGLVRQSFDNGQGEVDFAMAARFAEKRDRRQTVPLQYAAEFPDETGQYDLDSIQSGVINNNNNLETTQITADKMMARSNFAKPRPRILVEPSRTGETAEIDGERPPISPTKQVSFSNNVVQPKFTSKTSLRTTMQQTFLNQQAQAGITQEQPSQKVQFEQTAYGTPAFSKAKSQDDQSSTASQHPPETGATEQGRNPHELDQKYTSIQMMQFEEGSEQMIEEEIEMQSNMLTPSAATKQMALNSFGEQITEQHRTQSHVLSSESHNQQRMAPDSSYNWQAGQSDQDRSDLLSLSQSQPPGVRQATSSGQWNHQELQSELSETQFDDRDDLQTASQITEDIFSRAGPSGKDTMMRNHEDQADGQMEEDPPRLVKKRTLARDSERYVQSTHDVSKFKDLGGNQGPAAFDGTGNFQDAFNLVDHSQYDLSVQEPQQNRMNYAHQNLDPNAEYLLPPDSEYQHQDSSALRQFSGLYTQGVLSEHMPELLVTQDISALLDLSKFAQVFGPDGKPASSSFSNSLKIKRTKQLGSGTQGEVYLSKITASGKEFTCVLKLRKILNNDRLCESIFVNMFKEFEIGRQLSHPGIIKNLYYVRKKNDSDEQENAILLELMEGGNAQEYIDGLPDKKITDMATLKSFTRQICEAVQYLHRMKIVHQDLKPENILLSSDYKTVKLCDFGVSNQLDRTRNLTDAKGTFRFMSPELLDSTLTNKADVWAIGCILLQFVTGVLPFHGKANEISISMKIFAGVTPLDYAKSKLKSELYGAETLEQGSTLFCQSANLRQFIEACLTWDYAQRPTSADLLTSPFLQEP